MSAKTSILTAIIVVAIGSAIGATAGILRRGSEKAPTQARASTAPATPSSDAGLATFLPTSSTPSAVDSPTATPAVVELDARLGIEEAYRWDLMLDLNGAVAIGVVSDSKTDSETSEDGLPRLFSYFGVDIEQWISSPIADLPDVSHVTLRQTGGADEGYVEIVEGDELLEVGQRYLFLMVPRALSRPGLPYGDLTTAAPYATFKIADGRLIARRGFLELPIPKQLNGVTEAEAITLITKELARRGEATPADGATE